MKNIFSKVKDIFKRRKKIECHKYTRHLKRYTDGKLKVKQQRLLIERIGLDLFEKLLKVNYI